MFLLGDSTSGQSTSNQLTPQNMGNESSEISADAESHLVSSIHTKFYSEELYYTTVYSIYTGYFLNCRFVIKYLFRVLR